MAHNDAPADLTSEVGGPAHQLERGRPRVPPAIEGAVAALLMGALFLITFSNVVVRYFTSASFAFTEEYSVALMVTMAFVGSASAFALDRQIRMNFFVDRLAFAPRRAIELFVIVVCAAFFAALAWYGGRYVWDEYRFEVLSPGLGVPQWMYTMALPLCSGLIVARLLGRLVRVLRAQSPAARA
jgi:TRAP-type C4-dicarboxylate transport system permease small subunit